MVEAYCVKCRCNRPMTGRMIKKIAINGAPFMQSKCPQCGCNLNRFGSKVNNGGDLFSALSNIGEKLFGEQIANWKSVADAN